MSTNEQEPSSIEKALMKVAEGFKDYFCKVFERDFNQTPDLTTVNVNKIKMEKKIGVTGIRLVTVAFSTNLGDYQALLAVKTMDSPEKAKETLQRIEFVTEMLAKAPISGLTTPQVIFEGSSLVVMEGIVGAAFRESPVPQTEKLRLAGRAIAALHGSEGTEPSKERYKLLPQKVIEALPINQDLKGSLLQLFEKHIETIINQNLNCGAYSFGDFHPGNIMFEVREHQTPIIMTHLIDPEFLDVSRTVDRSEDICNFFVTQIVSDGLEKTKKDLSAFMSGYNEVLAYYGNGRGLSQYYETEVPSLNFHLAQGVLLSILNILGMPPDLFGGSEGLSNEVTNRINLTNTILTEAPIY